ncbi:hypothetical protein [Oceaniglobus ichthyenteri]|uniref:hypothetical protein n=1 Tax=Oceaniglobus ichthyenteri TaxID=2136177 RepID=UPI000D3BA788|nr:hypothetical protein [Oceaniglobus ichthyenteri]
MHDMSELERRISAALDRISINVATLQRPAPAPDPVKEPEQDDLPPASELQADLEAERAVTAQLEERVRAIKEKQDTKVATLETDLEAARNRIAALEAENTDLRENTSKGDDDGDDSLRAQLAALKEQRATERAELAELLAHLQPIVEESASA